MSKKEFITQLINTNKVVIFSKTYCPYCTAAKKLFDQLQQQYKAVELDRMEDGDEIQNSLAQMTGQRTVPSVWVNKQFVGGNDKTQAAHKNGTLEELLQSSL